MKKIIFTTLILCSSLAQAHGFNRFHHHRHYHGYNDWVAPLIIGGVIGYEIQRHNQPPVVVQQQTIPNNNGNCTPWTETMNSDGTVTRTRTCY